MVASELEYCCSLDIGQNYGSLHENTIYTFFIFFVNNFANASDFELTVYFNLSASEKHGLIRCRLGGNKLKAEYHLIAIKNEPKYTILGNLDLNEDVIGNVEGVSYCNEGKFVLRKSINNSEDSINLSIYLFIWWKHI